MAARYTDLIERLERATEGSRELDFECHKVLHPWLSSAVKREIGWADVGGSYDPDCLLWWEEGRDKPFHDHLPHYSTSLDAALTLVPEGVPYCIGGRQTPETRPWARVGEPPFGMDTTAPTVVLALCIACLKALQSMEAA